MSTSNWTDAGAITPTDNETEAAALAMSAFVGQFTGRARMVSAAAGAVVYNRTVRPLTYDAAKTGTAANVAKLVAAPTISATDRAAILAYIA